MGQVELPSSKPLLGALAENLDTLQSAGIKVKIVLESDKILDVGENGDELVIGLEPDSNVINAMEKLAPAVMVTYDMEMKEGKMEYKNAKAHILPLTTFNVVCPLCGEEHTYYAGHIPYAYPKACPKCGAGVSTEYGDINDVYEALDSVLPVDTVLGIGKIKKGVYRLSNEGEMVIVAVLVNPDEGEEERGLWFLFWVSNEVRLNAGHLFTLAEEGRLLRMGVVIRYDGVEGRDFVIKTAKKIGGRYAGIYLPPDWINLRVLVLAESEEYPEEVYLDNVEEGS